MDRRLLGASGFFSESLALEGHTGGGFFKEADPFERLVFLERPEACVGGSFFLACLGAGCDGVVSDVALQCGRFAALPAAFEGDGGGALRLECDFLPNCLV